MYTTAQNVKEYVGDCSLTKKQIEAQIKNASLFMDKHVGYKIGYIKDTPLKDLLFSGNDWNYVNFDNTWVSGYTSVEIDGVDVTSEVVSLPLNEDYKHGIMRKSGTFPEGVANISVLGAKVGAYVVAFGETEHLLPDDLTHACTLLTQSFIKKADPDQDETQGDIVAEKTSQYSIQYGTTKNATELETEAIKIINNYTQFAIA